MKKYFYVTFILCTVLTFKSIQLHAQDEKFKSIFIYNFTKFIEWPNTASNDFKIAVLGNSLVVNELSNIASKMKVGSKTIVVSKLESANELTNVQIVYVAASKTSELNALLEKAKILGILVVCEKAQSCQKGAAINFISKNGNLNFEISRKNIESCGLKVNSALIALGSNVE